MIKYKALDLFCGAGGASMGLKQAGFDYIMGVDINLQNEYPRLNGFDFVQCDVFKLFFIRKDIQENLISSGLHRHARDTSGLIQSGQIETKNTPI